MIITYNYWESGTDTRGGAQTRGEGHRHAGRGTTHPTASTTTTTTTSTTNYWSLIQKDGGTKKSPKRLAIEAEGRERPHLGDDGTKKYLVMAGVNLVRGRDEITVAEALSASMFDSGCVCSAPSTLSLS